MSSLPEPSTDVTSRRQPSVEIWQIVSDRLFECGTSAIAKSEEMEAALNAIEGLPSQGDLETEASELMRLAADFISEHIAMHAISQGFLHLSHEDLLTSTSLVRPTSVKQGQDFLERAAAADAFVKRAHVAYWASLHSVASGDLTDKASLRAKLKGGSTATTQKRLCTLLTEPTQRQLPACKALWRNVGPALESTKRFAAITDDLITPNADWLAYPQLVSVIADGAAKMADRSFPYKPPTSTPEDAGEASTEAAAAAQSTTESSSPPRSGRFAKLLSSFKPDKGKDLQGSRAP